MDKPAKPKDTFYLFRRERTQGEGYENLYDSRKKWRKLSDKETRELEEYKQFAINKYDSKR